MAPKLSESLHNSDRHENRAGEGLVLARSVAYGTRVNGSSCLFDYGCRTRRSNGIMKLIGKVVFWNSPWN